MPKIVLDAETTRKLGTAQQRAELCAPDGKVLGYFHPAVDPNLYKAVQVPFAEQDLDQFEREPGGRSLEEIMKDLRARQ